MSWTRTLKTTTHTFIFHKIALLTNQTNQGRSQQPISLSARCTIFHTNYNHGQKSWDTFPFLEHFQIHTGPTPPVIPQTKLDGCIQNFFRVSTLYRAKGGRTSRKFRKRCNVL